MQLIYLQFLSLFALHGVVDVKLDVLQNLKKSSSVICIVTTRKRSLRRLCFYMCLSVHGEGWHAWQGACVAGGCMAGGHVWQGGMHGGVWHVWRGGVHGKGACMAGGHLWQGVCVANNARYSQ